MRVVYLCRFIPSWRVPQLRAIVAHPGSDIRLKVLGCSAKRGNPKHNDVHGHAESRLVVEQLESIQFTLRSFNRASDWYFTPGLVTRLVKEKPDVILLEGGSNLPNNLIAYAYALGTGTPVVWWSLGTLRGRKYTWLGKIYRFVVKNLERRADALIGYSTSAISYFVSLGISTKRCFLALNVIDVDSIIRRTPDLLHFRKESRTRLGIAPDEPVLLFVGTMNSEKRVLLLPRILSRVKTARSSARLIIIGDGEEQGKLKRLTEQMGLSHDIEFIGKMNEGTDSFFASASVLVLPGLGGLVISESLAWGTPVVCSYADGTELDFAQDGVSAKVLPYEEDDGKAAEIFANVVLETLGMHEDNEALPLAVRGVITNGKTLGSYADGVVSALIYAKDAN